LADLNGDGRQELLFTALDGSLKATFFNANGTLASTLNSVARHGVQSLGQQISADFNGDGVLDSIWRQGSNNRIQVAYGTKNASTGVVSYGVWQNVSGAIPTGGTFSDNLFALDLNGDLKAELIWVKSGAGGAATGAATVLRNATAQRAPAWSVNNTSGNTTGMSNASPGIVSFEDVNGDGRLDLIRTTAPGYESVFLGQTNGGLGALLTMNKVEIKTPSDSTNYDLSASSNTQATIYGNALGQTITGTNWNDSIYGFDGNDTLNGGAGNDTLEGGIGNDTLNGGAGADTYLFTRGDGQDTIQDSDQTAGLNDVLQFETTVSANQLWFRKAGATNDLEISVIGTVDKVTVKDWYVGPAMQIEEIYDGTGKKLVAANVANLVNAMASFAPPASGELTLPQATAATLNPIIAANWKV
jgi:Ca2+-binding RTX toxin-like protein